MRKWSWLLWLLFAVMMSACNLTTQPIATASLTTDTPEQLPPTVTPLVLTTQPTLQPPPLNAGATFPPGAMCQVYTTFSGADPNNLLSLRAQPSVNANQVLKL